MSVSLADMATWEQTAYDADKPMMVATNNSDKITKASSGWFSSTTGSDETDEDTITNARVRAYDRIGALTVASKMTSTPSSPAFRFAFGSDVTFDTVVIMGHNFGDVDTENSNCMTSVAQINVLCATYPGDFLSIIAVIVCGESRT